MTLVQLFTAIANAIRAKKGTSGTITASNFPTEIAGIQTGHLTNEEYQSANDDLDDILEGSTPVTIYPPDWSELGYTTTPKAILDGFNYGKTIKDNWDVSASLTTKFIDDTNLMFMPIVDLGVNTNARGMLQRCSSLLYIPQIDTSGITNMQSMCSGCSNLRYIAVLDTSSVTNMSSIFTSCSSLTNESLNNIMAMCLNSSVPEARKTLAYLGLTPAQATTCTTLSNWQACVDAGWTTGY